MRIFPNTFLFFAIQGDAFEFFENSPFAGIRILKNIPQIRIQVG